VLLNWNKIQLFSTSEKLSSEMGGFFCLIDILNSIFYTKSKNSLDFQNFLFIKKGAYSSSSISGSVVASVGFAPK